MNKKTDRSFVTIVSIIAGLGLLIILAVTLSDPIIAMIQLNDIKKFNTKDNVVSIVYTEPLTAGDETFSNKQIVLDGAEADEVSFDVELLLKNIKYHKTISNTSVEWNKNIVLYNDIDTRTIYLGDNSVFIRKGKAVIEYKINDDYKQTYKSFLDKFK